MNVRINVYMDAVDKISTAIDSCDGSVNSVVKLTGMSRATVYRYISITPHLKSKIYYAQIKNLYSLIKLNKKNIQEYDKAFYSDRKVKKYLDQRSG